MVNTRSKQQSYILLQKYFYRVQLRTPHQVISQTAEFGSILVAGFCLVCRGVLSAGLVRPKTMELKLMDKVEKLTSCEISGDFAGWLLAHCARDAGSINH